MRNRLFQALLAASIVYFSAIFSTGSAIADWTHPLSFRNAELSGRNFAGESLQASLFFQHKSRTD